jgi:hypothetical protein
VRAGESYQVPPGAIHDARKLDADQRGFFAHWHSLICGSAHPEAAIECLRNALRAAPDYIDAMFNFALLLTFRARRSSFAMIRVALGMSDSKCAGRPARSRWCKSTTMKE